MEEKQINDILEEELVELLKSMPDNRIIRVLFEEDVSDGEKE